MIAKRTAYSAGTVASAALLALVMPSSAFAAGTGHAWNNSPSTNECLAAAGNYNGVGAIMWTCDGESGQQWSAVSDGDNAAVLRNGNGGCLDAGSSGTQVWVQFCTPGSEDEWEAWYKYTNTEGDVEWQNVATGDCLSVSGGSIANGAEVITWKCQGTLDQYWGGSLG